MPAEPWLRFRGECPGWLIEKPGIWNIVLEYAGCGIESAMEFYSGIGGDGRSAGELEGSIQHMSANSVYKHNFGMQPCMSSIEHLRVSDLDRKARVWLMSPPCQPFTRAGNQKDLEDNRTKSFVHLLDLLGQMRTPPDYILLENVKGFDVSNMRKLMLSRLESCGFHCAEFMLQPTQFGIPNTRLRYYLLARRTKPFPPSKDGEPFYTAIPSIHTHSSRDDKQHSRDVDRVVPSLKEYFGTDYEYKQDELKSFMVPKRVLERCKGYRFHVAAPWSKNTTCFTKAYGSKHVKGTGSVVSIYEWRGGVDEMTASDSSVAEFRVVESGEPLRFFTPREALRLHGFPRGFRFPPELTHRQAWACIGNSLNVVVVSELLKCLLGA